jgi:hypothetical protein
MSNATQNEIAVGLNHQPNEDFDISGTLRSYRSHGFSNRNCVNEAIDNVKDSGASQIEIYLFKDEKDNKHYFVTVGNGDGLTVDELKKIQRLQQWKSASNKQGRFGHGYGVLRSVFSENTGKVIWLSCHTDLNELQKSDPFQSGKYAQIEIDMDLCIQQNLIHKVPNDELSRRNERFWNKFAIEKHKTGTVVMIEMPERKFKELEANFSSPEPEKNIILGCTRDYGNLIREGLILKFNGETITPLPRPSEQHSKTKKRQIWECEPIDDELWIGTNIKKKIKTYVTIEEDEEGNPLPNTMKMYYKNNNRRTKTVSNPENIIFPEDYYWEGGEEEEDEEDDEEDEEDEDTTPKVTLLKKICVIESIFIHDKGGYFEENRVFFENLGIIAMRQTLLSQSLQAMIIADLVCRNGKMILMDPDTESDSGNTDKLRCRNDVINIFHLDYTGLDNEDANKLDKLFGINVNKGEIYRRNLNDDTKFIIGCIKSLVNKSYFYETVILPPYILKVQAEKAAELATQETQQKSNSEDDVEDEEEEEEEDEDEDDEDEDEDDEDEDEDDEDEDEDDEDEAEDEDDEVHNENDDNNPPPPMDQNTHRVELVVTESDEDNDLPISDNTTIPSHDRLCSKTAANARDALPPAWSKMSRNKRMKTFKQYWVHQLTCDEIYEILECIIAKQCNIDENAKLCGAAELVQVATAEETPNNSSDSE